MSDKWGLKAVLSADASGIVSALKSVGAMSDRTRGHLLKIASSAKTLASTVGISTGAVSAMAGSFGALKVHDAMGDLVKSTREVETFSSALGLSYNNLKQLQYVVAQAGVEFDEVMDLFTDFSPKIKEAADGDNKDLAAMFKKMGISLRAANGDLRSATDLLPELADAMNRNTNSTVKMTIGNALFGEQWARLQPVLKMGSAGIKEMGNRFDSLGLSIDDVSYKKQIDDVNKYAYAVGDFAAVSKGFSATIAQGLIPVITPVIEEITKWLAANRQLVASEVKAFVTDFANELRQVDVKAVVANIKSFGQNLKGFVESVGGAKNAMILFVAVMNAPVIMAVGVIAVEIWGATAALVSFGLAAVAASGTAVLSLLRIAAVAIATAGPLGALRIALVMAGQAVLGVSRALLLSPIGVVIGLATAAYLVYKNWDSIKKWFGEFFDYLGDKFSWLVNIIKSVGNMFKTNMDFSAGLPQGNTYDGEFSRVGGVLSAPGGAMPRGFDSSNLLTAAQPPARVQTSGKIEIDFKNAPQNMQVNKIDQTGDVPVKANVGYRWDAFGG